MRLIDRLPSGVHPVSFFRGNVSAAFSGREYSRARFSEFLPTAGFPSDLLVRPKQVHGNEIILCHSRESGNPFVIGSPMKVFGDDPLIEADALLTNLPGPVLGILTADCIPAFFWDPDRKVAGLAHAGWRGLKAGILEKMILQMRESFGSAPENIQVVLGPFIRACCYEVGKEFAEFFPSFYRPVSGAKGRMDLAAAAREILFAQGIRAASLQDLGICTSCRRDSFFSARRGDGEERILSVIQIGTVP